MAIDYICCPSFLIFDWFCGFINIKPRLSTMVEHSCMITYVPYRYTIKAVLLSSLLLQCFQPHFHAFEEAMSSQEPSSRPGVRQQHSNEAAIDPVAIPGTLSSGACILSAHSASDAVDAPAQITLGIFTASSGEAVQFIQLGAQWQAVVRDDKTRMVPQQTLPVRSADKDIDKLLAQLQLQGKESAKTRIHVVQKYDSPDSAACVYLGRLGLLGGMPKNKRQQEEGIVERKLPRATRQSDNRSAEQESEEITFTENDAILGRNGPTKEDRKGSLYEQLLDAWWDDYSKVPFAEKEDFAVKKVMNPVREQGGRFMRWDSNKEQYRVMEEKEERDIAKTVMQALRDRRKNTPEKPRRRAYAQGVEYLQPLRDEASCPEQDCKPFGGAAIALSHGQKQARVLYQQTDCSEQDCEPFGASTIALSHWQKRAEALYEQVHCTEQDGKSSTIDPLRGKKQEIIEPERPFYAFQPENIVPQRRSEVLQMGLLSGVSENKRLQGESAANRKLPRATRQSANRGTEQEGEEITFTENDAILGCNGPTKEDRKGSLYEQLLDAWWDDYSKVPFAEKEDFAVKKVMNPVREQGGRFMRWDSNKEQYRVMEQKEEREITKTVMQALRDRRKNTPEKPRRRAYARGVEYMQPLRDEASCPEQDCKPFGGAAVALSHGQKQARALYQQDNYLRQEGKSFGGSAFELFSRGQKQARSPYQQDNYLEQDYEPLSVSAVAFSHGQKQASAPYQQDNYLEQDYEPLSGSAVALSHGQKQARASYQQDNYLEQDCEPFDGSAVALSRGQERGKSPDQPTNYSGQDLESRSVSAVKLSCLRERAAALYQRNKYLEQYLEARNLPAVGLSYFWKRAAALYQQAQCLEQRLEPRNLPAVEWPYYWQEHAEALYQQANCPEQDGKLPAIDPLHGGKQDIIQPEQPIYTLQLRDSDAILGRNGPTKADLEGSFYEQLIHVLWDEYSKIPLTEREDFAVNRVINPVREQGGRFMRWDTNRQQYRVMEEREEKEIAKTVMQSLRDCRKNTPENPKGGIYAQGVEGALLLRQGGSCPERDLEPLGVSTPELPYGQKEAKSPDQRLNCPEQYLEPLGASTPELPHGQKHVEAPEQQDHCPEQDL
jgi:hypothetical protein